MGSPSPSSSASPSASPSASSTSGTPSTPNATPSPQADYPPIPPLADVPSNAYQLLVNLSNAIDTAAGTFHTSVGKLSTVQATTNTAVGDVVANSKGEVTNGLNDVWHYTRQDFTNASTPLTSITAANALGGSPNQLQAVLDQYGPAIQNGVPAVEQLRHLVATNFASAPTVEAVQELVNLAQGLTNALGNVNMALWMMISAINTINGGISYTCQTGFSPSSPPPLFTQQAFAMEGNGGSGGGSGMTEDDLANYLEDQGVDPYTATEISLLAMEQGLDLSEIQKIIDALTTNNEGDSELAMTQIQQWLNNNTLYDWRYGTGTAKNLNDVTTLLNQGVDPDALSQLLNNNANLDTISQHLPDLIKQPGEANPGQLAVWMQNLDADQLATLKNRIAQNPKLSISDAQQLVDPQLQYKPNPKHDAPTGYVAPQPNEGVAALNNSVLISENSTRRIGIDPTTDQIVVLADSNDGTYHGYVCTWNQLNQQMQNALQQDGLISSTGRVILRDAQGNITGYGPKVH